MSGAPVFGLVLAGGRSTRMQRDKATLAYHGRTQLEWAMELVAPHVARAFVSVRPDQREDPVRARFPQIVDAQPGIGPVAGILAAQAAHPEVAWLVLACDLPYLDADTLATLLAARRPERCATAYASARDGLPEPLCAIWEPRSRVALADFVATGQDCPRKFLIDSDLELIAPPRADALANINTPEEYGAALNRLGAGAAPARARRVRVQYYALLREQSGRSEEALETVARTPLELYAELRARYPFTLAPDLLRVAINAEFADWSQSLRDGDSVVFIPPVAGG